MDNENNNLVAVLKNGGIAVMPTDTTYGIVGLAQNERTVHEIYRLRKRDLDKPFIILIADRKDLEKFGVMPTAAQEKILERVWPVCVRTRTGRPGPTSVILSCADEKFAYLHRGRNTLGGFAPPQPAPPHLLPQAGPPLAPF